MKASLPKATSLIEVSCASVPTLGQVDDLMLVDTEDHLRLTRQLDDEFQLLAGRMHQLDSHIAFDLGNFSAEVRMTSITPMSASSGRDRCCCAPERSG